MSKFKMGGVGGEPIPETPCDMAKFFALADESIRRCLDSPKERTRQDAIRTQRRLERESQWRHMREALPDLFGWSPRSY